MLSHGVFARLIRPLVLVGFLLGLSYLLIAVSCDDEDNPFWSSLVEQSEPVDEYALPVTRTAWHIASEPYQLHDQNYVRGRLLWHAPRYLWSYSDIYDGYTPVLDNVRTLRMIFRPAGSVNSWTGITACYQNDIPDSMDCFELRVLGDRGKLHLDIGKVSEDVDGDGIAFSEDLDANGYVSEEEDVGLDGLPDELEPGYDAVTNPDPNGDNWYFLGEGKCPVGDCDTVDWESNEWRFEFLNGTEGNRYDPSVAGLPDAERLCQGPTGMQRIDTYFSVCVDLSTDSFLVAGSELNGWRTFRIPIRDSSVMDTVMSYVYEPNWQDLRNVRVWFEADESQTQPDTVEIAHWRFTQLEQ